IAGSPSLALVSAAVMPRRTPRYSLYSGCSICDGALTVFIACVGVWPLAIVPSSSSKSAPIRRYVNSTSPIPGFSVLYLISIPSSEVLCYYFCVSCAPADGPKLASGAHLENDLVERSSWWSKHHIAHPGIVCTPMTRTHETSASRIEIHGTARVRAPSAVRTVFVLAQAQQHSRIVSCGIVEVKTGPGQQHLCAFNLPRRIRNHRVLRCNDLTNSWRQQETR